MLKKNKDIFQILSNAVSEGIIIVDADQNIVSVNISANVMFGYSNDELFKKPLNTLIPKNHHSNHDSSFKAFYNNKEKRKIGSGIDLFGLHKSGYEFPVEIGLNPFTIFDKTYVMALVVDVTEQKNYTQKLEKTVELRTKQLETSLKQEKNLNELKTKFLSLVSHELKTPLSTILTSCILLSKYALPEQQDKRDKHIKMITDKVKYLNNILDDFLSLEKLESGKINHKFTHFSLSTLINEVVYNASMMLKEGQQIKCSENVNDIALMQDEKTLELALFNLVHNAIKYSSENSIVYINVTQNDSKTIFEVIDSGIGIPQKDQKNIFQRYFRAENVLITQGTGIGLNIAKSHIENLDGTITFKSQENKGSTFTLTIPNNAS